MKPRIKVKAGRRETADVVTLDVVTSLDIDADRMLDHARAARLEGVVILGWDADGEEYFGSSIADGGNVLWLLERMKLDLLTIRTPMTEPAPEHGGVVLPFPGGEDPT